jgi:hypothetical protein
VGKIQYAFTAMLTYPDAPAAQYAFISVQREQGMARIYRNLPVDFLEMSVGKLEMCDMCDLLQVAFSILIAVRAVQAVVAHQQVE